MRAGAAELYEALDALARRALEAMRAQDDSIFYACMICARSKILVGLLFDGGEKGECRRFTGWIGLS